MDGRSQVDAAPDEPPRLGPRARPWLGVASITVAMVAVSAVLLALHPRDLVADGASTLTWVAVLALFVLAEAAPVFLPTARNSHTHSMRELPAVLGLVFLSPSQYVVAYVLGAVLTKLLRWRQRGLKLGFNVSLFLLEAVLTSVVYHAVLGPSADPAGVRGWLAALAALILADIISSVAVTAVISLSENRLDATVLREALRAGLPAEVISTCVALVFVVLVEDRPVALVLMAVVAGLLVLAYRRYASVVRGLDRLQALYRFVGSTGRAAELDDTMVSVMGEASALLQAEKAELVIASRDGDGTTLFSLCPDGGLLSRDVPYAHVARAWWASALSGTSVLLPSGHGGERDLTAQLPRDGIAVPLESEGLRGVFLVADRTFDKETFDERDMQLFETLSAHAAVTLENARLVDRLRRVAAEREHDALHDALTGLPNRRAFNEAVARTLSAGGGGAVLLMDLDDFKDVNDTLGHRAGDELLQVTGRRLRAMVVEDRDAPAPGTVARLGGDEFAVLLPGVGADEAVVRARQLLDSVTAPVPMQDITLTTTASIGVAPIPLDARDSDELLVHADVAMYAAKAAGTGVAPYVPEDTDAVHRRLALAGELPSAIEQRAFEMWCQPQTDARTGAVTGAEALLRWWHPSYGWVPPTEVVAIAERTGVLGRLTLAVLAESLHLRSEWARAGHELDISVNVTARDISDLSLPGSVGALLAATGTPPSSLVLEITESGVMSDPERSMEVLAALHRLGVGVSVDDFGTGHSSLAYLERLPVNEVKIDQSFVKRLELEATDSTVVRSIVLLAHDLGMRVVAEGVESEVARQRVEALGCELVQGFVIARPMPGDQVPGWVGGRGAQRAQD